MCVSIIYNRHPSCATMFVYILYNNSLYIIHFQCRKADCALCFAESEKGWTLNCLVNAAVAVAVVWRRRRCRPGVMIDQRLIQTIYYIESRKRDGNKDDSENNV